MVRKVKECEDNKTHYTAGAQKTEAAWPWTRGLLVFTTGEAKKFK